MAQAAPKKSKLKGLFGPKDAHKDHSKPLKAVAQPAAHDTNGLLNANCSCCRKKITIRQSFRKSKCHGCGGRVCKKCYVVRKLCHACAVKQRPEVNSVAELNRMQPERLASLLEEVHCQPSSFKGDRQAMIHALLGQCQLRTLLTEYQATQAPPKTPRAIQAARAPTKQPDNLPPNAIFIDMHRISMPPQADDDHMPTALQHMLNQLEEAQRMAHGPARPTSQEPSTVIEGQLQSMEVQSQSIERQSIEGQLDGQRSTFLPHHVIEEEDEEEPEVEPITPLYTTPPLTPTLNRKSQADIFYSTDDIPQLGDELYHGTQLEQTEVMDRAEVEQIRSDIKAQLENNKANFQTEVEKNIEQFQKPTEHNGIIDHTQLEQIEVNRQSETEVEYRGIQTEIRTHLKRETEMEHAERNFHSELEQTETNHKTVEIVTETEIKERTRWTGNGTLIRTEEGETGDSLRTEMELNEDQYQEHLRRMDSNYQTETEFLFCYAPTKGERNGTGHPEEEDVDVEAIRAKIRAEIESSDMNFLMEDENSEESSEPEMTNGYHQTELNEMEYLTKGKLFGANLLTEIEKIKTHIQSEVEHIEKKVPKNLEPDRTDYKQEMELYSDDEEIYENVVRKSKKMERNENFEQNDEKFQKVRQEVKSEVLEELYKPVNVKAEVTKFERKLDTLNHEYQAQYKLKFEDLTTIRDEREIRRMSLFQLKTILQRRGKSIVGLSYEDYVQAVIRLWTEEKIAKERETIGHETKKREEKERVEMEQEVERQLEREIKLELQRKRMEEEELERNRKHSQNKRQLEEERERVREELERLEEAKLFREMYEEEQRTRLFPLQVHENGSDDEKEPEMAFEEEPEVDDVQQRIEMEIIANQLHMEQLSSIKFHHQQKEWPSSYAPEVECYKEEEPHTPTPSPTGFEKKEEFLVPVYEEIICEDGRSKCTGYDDDDDDYL